MPQRPALPILFFFLPIRLLDSLGGTEDLVMDLFGSATHNVCRVEDGWTADAKWFYFRERALSSELFSNDT